MLELKGITKKYHYFPALYDVSFTAEPGKERMHIFWIVYLFGFILYIGLASYIEALLFVEPFRFMAFFGGVLFAVVLIRIYQNYFFYKRLEFLYEEKLEPVMLGLETDIE